MTYGYPCNRIAASSLWQQERAYDRQQRFPHYRGVNGTAAEAGAVAIADPRPLRDNGYKAPMAANLVARAVGSLLSNAG